jgi:hypothetical protein
MAEPTPVAVMEEAPFTGGWRNPAYFYSVAAAERAIAEAREHNPSKDYRLRIL